MRDVPIKFGDNMLGNFTYAKKKIQNSIKEELNDLEH